MQTLPHIQRGFSAGRENEVSRRSPLAPWKLLVRTIVSYYRGDGEACAEQLDAIAAGSISIYH